MIKKGWFSNIFHSEIVGLMFLTVFLLLSSSGTVNALPDTTPPVVEVIPVAPLTQFGPLNFYFVDESLDGMPGTGDRTASGAVQFVVSGTDDVTPPGNLTIESNPASGDPFLLGDNTVVATVTDEAGNSATVEFTVSIRNIGPAPADANNPPTVVLDGGKIWVEFPYGIGAAGASLTVEPRYYVPDLMSIPAQEGFFLFGLGPVPVFDIDAEGNTTPGATVCIIYDPMGMSPADQESVPIQFWHNGGTGPGSWTNITNGPKDGHCDGGNPPPGGGTVCGYVDDRWGSLNTPPVADAGVDQTVNRFQMVTLDPTGSYDPDGNLPLTYAWTLTSKPAGSTAELLPLDPIFSKLTPDLPGTYTVELVVTDSLGAASAPDEVVISTFNSKPVADAGEDRALDELGILVALDGTGSYDDDGDPINYSWTIETLPAGSSASLDDSTSETPSFVPDVYGSYKFKLVVIDPWEESDPDDVTVSFENLAPVANAGVNQSVEVGESVTLDGSGSYDPNGDPLTYSWGFVSQPPDSSAVIVNPTLEIASFIPDVDGIYVVSLIVNDSLLDSIPSIVTITATYTQGQVEEKLDDCIDAINALSPDSFKNKNMQNALTKKIIATLELIDQGLYQEALDKLLHDILAKTNGCAKTNSPDKNDWIKDCLSQTAVYDQLMDAINVLEGMI